jgi:peroxin-6
MDAQNGAVHPRKRRRRRRLDRPPISARLLLDDRVKGEVGVLSEDLFNDLFPASRSKSTGMYKKVSVVDVSDMC